MHDLSVLEINGVPYDLRDPTKAPAGYGLGGNATTLYGSASDITASGWYYYTQALGFSTDVPSYEGIILASVGPYSTRLDAFPLSNSAQAGCHATLTKNWDTWDKEWEWENPPMVAGVEYRTTERWNGKAVYTKLINCGTGVDGSEYTLEEGCKIIRFCGHIAQAVTPYPADGSLTGSWSAYFSAWQNKIILHCGSSLSGTNDAYVAVWYYKL